MTREMHSTSRFSRPIAALRSPSTYRPIVATFRPRTLINERYDKFRHMGRYSSRISVAISKERAQIEEYLSQRLDGLKSLLPSKEVEVPLPKKEEEPPA